jgi:hypothetical protein
VYILNIDEIKLRAKKEIEEEDFRAEVEKYKEKLRQKKSIWDVLMPYKIIVIRKNKNV